MSLIGTCGIGSDPLCCEGFLPPSTVYYEKSMIYFTLALILIGCFYSKGYCGETYGVIDFQKIPRKK
jgi:hypothetical protein